MIQIKEAETKTSKTETINTEKPPVCSRSKMSINIRDPLIVSRVVGDVLDPFNRSITLKVTYGQREVTNGLDLRPSQVQNKPRVEIGGEDLRNFYTLVLSLELPFVSFLL